MKTALVTVGSGIGVAFMSLLGGLSALSYQLGEIAVIIPPEYKPTVTVVCFGAAFLLRCINIVATGRMQVMAQRIIDSQSKSN